MGMFDSVIFKCPSCGGEIEVQSKAGRCVLTHIDPDAVPLVIADDINGEPATCKSCYTVYTVEAVLPITTVPMRLR